MNIEVVKNNIMYHLINDFDYRMIMSKDQKNVWLINTNQPVYKAFFIHYENGEFFSDDIILQVLSKMSMDSVNRITKIAFNSEMVTTSGHVGAIIIDTETKSVSDPLFSTAFPQWNQWLTESSNLTNQDIERKMRSSLREKLKALRKKTAPKLSIAVISICVVMFLLTFFAGGKTNATTVAALNMGALYKPYVVGLGQVWRIITAGFLHASVFHLIMNCINLYYIGRVLEPFFAQKKWMYFFVLIVSIIAGNLVCLLDTGQTITLGISGGLFGMLGYYIIICLNNGYFKNPMIRRNLMYMLLINFYVSLLPNISFQAHLGGLVAGLCIGLWNTSYPKIKPILKHVRICIVILAVALVGIVIKDRNNYINSKELDHTMVVSNENTIFEWMYEGLK